MTITIITCTYNAAGVLKPTLDSVISQTYGKIEHIIIDGNSTDNTVSMNPDSNNKVTFFLSVILAPNWFPMGRNAMSTPNKKRVNPNTNRKEDKRKLMRETLQA